ncbi:MAG: hypothetical protein K6G62_04840 [Eubacterium sp.]|nr:hypothetical protein [Eubacterium sp.]
MSKKILCQFPGVHYSVDCPLLYYPALPYYRAGFEILPMDYRVQQVEDGLSQLKDYGAEALDHLIEDWRDYPWDSCQKVIFLEKSIGTLVGMGLEDALRAQGVKVPIHHLVLTPINKTLPLMREDRRMDYIVAGNKDRLIDLDRLTKQCKGLKAKPEILDGLGHRLEVEASVKKSLKIIDHIVNQCLKKCPAD